MDPSYIVDLIDWFEQWLQYTSSRSAKWHTDYAVNKQFWYAIGGMFSKLLGRRSDLVILKFSYQTDGSVEFHSPPPVHALAQMSSLVI